MFISVSYAIAKQDYVDDFQQVGTIMPFKFM